MNLFHPEGGNTGCGNTGWYTYDLQSKIPLNYSNSFNEIIYCSTIDPKTCDSAGEVSKFKELLTERNSLVDQLEKLNQETSILMGKFPEK